MKQKDKGIFSSRCPGVFFSLVVFVDLEIWEVFQSCKREAKQKAHRKIIHKHVNQSVSLTQPFLPI